MNLAEQFRNESTKANDKREEIVNEVIEYFREQFENGALERYLKKQILEEDVAAKRKFTMDVGFWNYHSGCTSTHFRVADIWWENPENPNGWESRRYKGIELQDMHKPVCEKVKTLTIEYLNKMGFSVYNEKNTESWLKYYHREFEVCW